MRGTPKHFADRRDVDNCLSGEGSTGLNIFLDSLNVNGLWSQYGFASAKECATLLESRNYISMYNIVFEGDSLTFGTGSTGNGTYPFYCQRDLNNPASCLFTNVSKGSDTLYDRRPGEPTYPGLLVDDLTQIDPLFSSAYLRNIAICECGTNDLTFGRSASQVYTDLQSWCSARHTAGFETIVLSILPRGGITSKKDALNASLRADHSFSDGFADVSSDPIIGPDAAVNDTTYYADGVHPTSAGYYIMAQYVANAILALH
jgi:lysophospholipase L1-like esterase